MDDQELFLRKLNRRTRFTQFLVWISLLLTVVGIAAGYKNWLRIHEKAKSGLAGIAEIKKEIPSFAKQKQLLSIQKQINEKLNKTTQQSENAIKQLSLVQKSTEHIAKNMYKQVEDITNTQQAVINIKQSTAIQDWSLSQIQFLLQTAIQVLTLKQDKHAAISALKLADNLLIKRGSNKFLPLRKQISEDIARLDEYKMPDLGKLSDKITQLQISLAPAPKDLTLQESVQKENNKQANQNQSKQEIKPKKNESFINKVKKTINDAVVIKKFEQPLQNEMDLETKETVSQLFSLKLEALRILLLQKQNKLYHKQLDQLKKFSKKYYPKQELAPLMQALDDLSNININPDLPDISSSLLLFQKMLTDKALEK